MPKKQVIWGKIVGLSAGHHIEKTKNPLSQNLRGFKM